MPNTYADELRDLARMLEEDFKGNSKAVWRKMVCMAMSLKVYNDAYPDPPVKPKSYTDGGKSKGEATFCDDGS